MRSGSTLLHHLLQTNPWVLGAGESTRVYRSIGDLRRLSLWAHSTAGSILTWRRFVTDQINHSHQLESESLLRRPDVHTVFLIREPHGTIGSTMAHLGKHYGWTLQRSVDYYLERTASLLRLMRELGQAQPRRAFGLTYASLTTDTVNTLARLQSHLGLPEALRETYGVYSYTGKRGDPSPRISAGMVLPPNPHADLKLDSRLEQNLQLAYEQTLSAMCGYCVIAPADEAK
jgi:hypothetical protein